MFEIYATLSKQFPSFRESSNKEHNLQEKFPAITVDIYLGNPYNEGHGKAHCPLQSD